MKNRPVWFVPGSAQKAFRVGERVSRLRTSLAASPDSPSIFLEGTLPARLVRRAIWVTALIIFAPLVCFGQEATPTPTPSPSEMEAEAIVVTATRFDIPLELSPASASVITSEDFEQKQIERISDALREVPGLRVVQTGTAGQLTAVFTRGLRSEHTQVLLDGIPINQGLQGAFNFADLTI